MWFVYFCIFFFFFQAEDGIRDLTVTGVQTCALPIFATSRKHTGRMLRETCRQCSSFILTQPFRATAMDGWHRTSGSTQSIVSFLKLIIDRKSTRLNSSHSQISYAVFCLKKKKKKAKI